MDRFFSKPRLSPAMSYQFPQMHPALPVPSWHLGEVPCCMFHLLLCWRALLCQRRMFPLLTTYSCLQFSSQDFQRKCHLPSAFPTNDPAWPTTQQGCLPGWDKLVAFLPVAQPNPFQRVHILLKGNIKEMFIFHQLWAKHIASVTPIENHVLMAWLLGNHQKCHGSSYHRSLDFRVTLKMPLIGHQHWCQ